MRIDTIGLTGTPDRSYLAPPCGRFGWRYPVWNILETPVWNIPHQAGATPSGTIRIKAPY